jgi:hypothetical protein
MCSALVSVHGGALAPAGLLGQGPARIPTAGKIRPGIMVLTRRAAERPEAKALYRQGVAEGRSFEQIERLLAEALPDLRSPLVPRNVPWFTVRAQDFPNPEVAEQIMAAYAEDRGQGRRLYRFPVVFPSDHWTTVMPHELACWTTHEKRYWSQYAPDGRQRLCLRHAPVPLDAGGRRTIRLFGGRKAVPREDNGGVCDPEVCPEYQNRQCNLTGRFVFFVPGVRSVCALELPTNSFYAMSRALQRFQAVAQLRGGRIAGFLGQERASFWLTKVQQEVAHLDEQGRAVRVPQWIIELEAPVDVTALLREREDEETALRQADRAAAVLERAKGDPVGAGRTTGPSDDAGGDASAAAAAAARSVAVEPPSIAQLLARAGAMGLRAETYLSFAARRFGNGWQRQVHDRARAWDELERHRNDPAGYADKVAAVLAR